MGRRPKNHVRPLPSDIIFRKEDARSWLSQLRQESGMSLRDLAAASSVATAAIHRIESENREWLLSTFVAICAELGAPPGWVLDLMLWSDIGLFARRVPEDPEFEHLVEASNLSEKWARDKLASYLAASCVLTATLLRTSAAGRRARIVQYPNRELQARFHQFADGLDSEIGPRQRSECVRRLKKSPVAELRRLGLVSPEMLEELRLVSLLPTEQRRGKFGGWLPLFPSYKEASEMWNLKLGRSIVATNELTDTETASKVLPVKAQLPGLLERLRKATEPTGKKTELAEFLSKQLSAKVPLASVSRWLSGEREPGGEVALQLDAWATAQGFPRAR